MKYISVLDGSEYKGKFPDQVELAETAGNEPIHYSRVVLYKGGEPGYNKGLERWMWHRCYLPDSQSDKGGEGSGNYGHSGLSGVWGGSTPTGRAPEESGGGEYGVYSEEEFTEGAQAGNDVSSMPMGGGVAEAVLVEYENGSWGIWKAIEDDDSWHNGHSEVAAYELSELLELGIVPATVYSELEGVEGTSQFFLRGSTVAERLEMEQKSGKMMVWDSHPQREKIALLDHLVGNTDRHEGNWMLNPDTGKLSAIDHGHCRWQNYYEDQSPLMGSGYTANFIPRASQENRSHTFSMGLMSDVYRVVGDSKWRRGSKYDAYIAGFSNLVQRAHRSEINSAWDKMIELVESDGTVTWPEW